MTLVAAAVISVGLTESYFSYQDSKRALTGFERDKASSAATSIEQLVQELLLDLDAVAQPTTSKGAPGCRSGIKTSIVSSIVTTRSAESATSTRAGTERVRTSALETDRIGDRRRSLAKPHIPPSRERSSAISAMCTSRTARLT